MAVEKIPIIWVVNDKELTDNERKLLKLRKATKMTEKDIKKFGQQSSQSFFNMGGAIRGLLPLLGVAGLAGALQQLVNTGKNFRAELQRLKALTGATGKPFKELVKDAKRLGESTRFTATQVAQLQVEFGKLGFSTKEILKATGATLALASVAQSDLANAAIVAGSTVRAFGLDASETIRVVDVMAEAFSSSALDIENFSEAIKFVAPIAKAANIEIEETVFLLAKLADSGLRGSIAGTGLKNVLSRLTTASSPLARSLGFTVNNAQDLQRAFTILAQQGVDLGRATELTDARAKTAFLTFVEGIGTTNELSSAFDNAAGSAQRMSDLIEDSLDGDIRRLKSAIEVLILTNDEGLNSSLRDLTTLLTNAVKGFTTLSDPIKFTKARLNETQLALDEVNQQLEAGEISRGRASASIRSLEKRIESLNEDLDKLTSQERQKGVQDLINEFITGFQKASDQTQQFIDTEFKQIETLTTLEEKLKDLQNQLKTTDITDTERIITINQSIKATQEEIKAIKLLGLALVDTRDKNISLVQSMQERAEVLRNILELLFPDEDGEFGGRVETVEDMNLRILNLVDMQIAKLIELGQIDKEINAARIEGLIEFEQANIAVFSSILGAFSQLTKDAGAAGAVFFAFQKVLAISEIIINLQRELALISATFAANPVLLGIQLARAKVAAAQRVGVITAQTIGGLAGFAEGGIDIRGAGGPKSDSNLVRISDHESIINAQATAQYAPLLHAINSRTLDPKIADAIASGKGGLDFDYERLGEEFEKHASRFSMVFDNKGFSFYQHRQNSRRRYLNNRYNV